MQCQVWHLTARGGASLNRRLLKWKEDRKTLAEDLLRGAALISTFVYGDASQPNRKRIYHLAESGAFPAFRMGNVLCARKSTLMAYIEAQERAAMAVFSKGKAA
jgi:hypothetical protein